MTLCTVITYMLKLYALEMERYMCIGPWEMPFIKTARVGSAENTPSQAHQGTKP